jgi:hypothetical protein
MYAVGRSRGVVREVPGVCLGLLAPPLRANGQQTTVLCFDISEFRIKTLGGGGLGARGRWDDKGRKGRTALLSSPTRGH